MQQQLIKISKLKYNTGQINGLSKNPRILRDSKFEQLKKSIEEDPEMLNLREIIAYDNDADLVVICGNMRLKALKELGIKEVNVKILPKHTPINKLKSYTIKDNVSFGEHDWETLANEWEVEELAHFGVDIPIEVVEEEKEQSIKHTKNITLTYSIEEADRIEEELYLIASTLEQAIQILLQK